jgi:hypothetical protein
MQYFRNPFRTKELEPNETCRHLRLSNEICGRAGGSPNSFCRTCQREPFLWILDLYPKQKLAFLYGVVATLVLMAIVIFVVGTTTLPPLPMQ